MREEGGGREGEKEPKKHQTQLYAIFDKKLHFRLFIVKNETTEFRLSLDQPTSSIICLRNSGQMVRKLDRLQ